MLTGKAKKDFVYQCVLIYEGFVSLPETCQNALIIDWFDSEGIYISIQPKRIISEWIFDVLINEEIDSVWSDRQEATTEAIKKANEIYNNLKK
jgi:hypothetical protein